MWVVKLGGSMAHDPTLRAWVSVLVACPDPVVIVPGGGPFADEVRRLQRTWLFDDVSAHALAMQAMDLFGRVVCALHPGLRPLYSLDVLNAESLEHAPRVWVWVPSHDVLADLSLEASWNVTSDSLSAWLAKRIKARGLLLVKSVEPRTEDTSLVTLISEGLVDRAFVEHGQRAGCPIGLLHRDRADQFDGWRAGRPGYGYVLDPAVSGLKRASGCSR